MAFTGDADGFALDFIREHLLGGGGGPVDSTVDPDDLTFPVPPPQPEFEPTMPFLPPPLPPQQHGYIDMDPTNEYMGEAAVAFPDPEPPAPPVVIAFGSQPSSPVRQPLTIAVPPRPYASAAATAPPAAAAEAVEDFRKYRGVRQRQVFLLIQEIIYRGDRKLNILQ
jgi:EREBP-like factor